MFTAAHADCSERTAALSGLRISVLASEHETGGSHSLLRYTMPPTADEDAFQHCHPSRSELIYVLSGCLTIFQERESTRLGPGALAIVAPGELHAFRNQSKRSTTFLVFAREGEPDGLEAEFLEEILNRHDRGLKVTA